MKWFGGQKPLTLWKPAEPQRKDFQNWSIGPLPPTLSEATWKLVPVKAQQGQHLKMSHQAFCMFRNDQGFGASYQCLCHEQKDFGTRSQHLSQGHGSRAGHAAFWLAASIHTTEAHRATTSNDSLSYSQLRWPKAGGQGRRRWRRPDILRLWRCAGQRRNIPCPIPNSQHTGSLPWPDSRKHLPRFKQV